MLRENLQNALKEAMKNHDTATVSAVRLIIAGQKEKDVAARGAGKECASDALHLFGNLSLFRKKGLSQA